MIELTVLSGQTIYLNPDKILYLEATPDTLLHLVNGDKHVLCESVDVVRERFMEYQKKLRYPMDCLPSEPIAELTANDYRADTV